MSMTLERVSERDQPLTNEKSKRRLNWSWEHLALGAILMLSAFLGLWNLSINGYSNNYYASAVRSMMQSWHNFFFASFDPGGFITVDKPPVALWVQTIFAKIFGFNGVSLLLPEALAGIAGVFLIYYMVKRAFGAGAGLLSALFLAVTPIFVAMNRDNNPDSILVFTLILAAWAMLRAAEKGRLRWLLVAGTLVGVAFNVKMLEAYIALPAFYLMYLLLARTSWLKRILHLTIATLLIAAVSLSWAVAVDLTPASQRPYVDSSSTNSELDLILNYNGLNRVEGNTMSSGGNMPSNSDGNSSTTQTNSTSSSSSSTSTSSSSSSNTQSGPPDFAGGTPPEGAPNGGTPPQGATNGGGNPGGGNNGFGGQSGPTRLLTPANAGEFNWFFPLALLGIVYVGAYAWFGMPKSEERTRRLQSVVLWGGWFLTFGVIFSISKGTFHPYYLTIMAPAEAALAGSATVLLWKRYRQGSWQGWLLPVGLAATAFYQAYILTGYTSWNQWLGPVLVVAGICSLIGLVLGRFLRTKRFGRGMALGVTGVTLAALLVTPTVWSVKAVFTSITGSLISSTPSGSGGMGSSNTQGTAQSWLSFVENNLSGQLLVVAVVVVIGAVLLGLGYLLRQRRLFNMPVVTGLLLAFLLVSSTGWWVGVAQAQTSQISANRSSMLDGNGGGMGGGEQVDSKLLSYLEANQGDYEYLVAVSSSNSAAPIIIQTGKAVMSLGGFAGNAKTITTTAEVEQLVSSHTVRYFMLGGGMGGGNQSSVVSQYVQQNCKVVDSSAYSTTSTSSSSTSTSTQSRDGFGGQQQQQLYVCGS
jgi:4-amino-4-deoxy-L-arabinose transferase-like glycosyltransferase